MTGDGQSEAAEKPATEDGFYSGVVREAQFSLEDRGELITFYYADVGMKQFEALKNQLEYYFDSGQEIKSEIHLYSTTISLKNYVGQEIKFKGDFFEAHTIHHARDIVFEIKEISVR